MKSQSLRVGMLLGVLVGAGGWKAEVRAQGAGGEDASKILASVTTKYRGVKGFCAHFRQEREVKLLKDLAKSEGELCQKQPNLFSMRFKDPKGDVIVMDGTYLWLYTPSMDKKQVIQTSIDGLEGSFDFRERFLVDPDKKFTPTYLRREELEGKKVHVLQLKPKEADSGYDWVRLWVDADDGMVRRLDYLEEGVETRLWLTKIRLDPEISPDTFQFSPPPGAQVIKR